MSATSFRSELREKVGARYFGWAHFWFTTLSSVAVIAYAATTVKAATTGEWLTIPLTFLFANFVEYIGHRGPMHHKRRGLSAVHQRHTVWHHGFFTHENMCVDDSRDFRWVLFPPVLVGFFFGVFAIPTGLALQYVTTPNVSSLFVATAVGYFLAYEWLHFAYHQKEGSLAGRIPGIAFLRRHHSRHHDPARMNEVNFNISFPVCDYLFGTAAKS
jgi:hypothetical protein